MEILMFLENLIGATFRISTPILLAATGETYAERSGVLNLGIEGTMLFGAFVGFFVADATGSLWIGLLMAIVFGVISGLLMGLLTVTLGVNQHVSGLSVTLLLTGLSLFAFRLNFGGSGGVPPRIDPFEQVRPLGDIPFFGGISEQYLLTYITFLGIVPLAWWVLYRTNFGLKIRAVGENPEAADAAGINVYAALHRAGDRRRPDGRRRGVPGAGAGGLFHPRDRFRARLGGNRHRHLRQLESQARDVGRADLWRHFCLAAAAAGDGLAAAHPLRGFPGAALYRDHHRAGDRRAQRFLPGSAAQAVPAGIE
jgi:hypothetical protein